MDSQTVSAFFLHPITCGLLEQLAIITILGFTSADSYLRPAFFPIILAYVWKFALISSKRNDQTLWAAFMSGTIIISLLNYVESVLISKWTFEAQGPTSSAGPEPLHTPHGNRNNRGGSFWKRCRFGFLATNSSRNIGTQYMVKNTPPFSFENPNYIPSRAAFLFRKFINILVAFLVIDLANQAAQPREFHTAFFSAEAVPIFTGTRENLTFEKIISRLVAVLVYWVCAYQAAEGYFSIPNFFVVSFDIKDVSLYRPHFGSIAEAYSVRQFWSVFWHQHLRKYFTSIADLIVYKALRLPKGKLFTRYLHLSLVFLVSGLLHTYMEFTEGLPARQSGQIQFFATQVVGIMLEDIVQAVFRATRGVKWGTPPTPVTRAVGYVWLAVFLWWSTPSVCKYIEEALKAVHGRKTNKSSAEHGSHNTIDRYRRVKMGEAKQENANSHTALD